MSKFGALIMGPAGAGKVRKTILTLSITTRANYFIDHLLLCPHKPPPEQPSILLLRQPRPRRRPVRTRARSRHQRPDLARRCHGGDGPGA